MRSLLAIIGILTISACAMPGRAVTTLVPPSPLEGTKEVAFLGHRTEVTRALEDSLRGRGVHIKRFASTSQTTELTSPGRMDTYNESAARHVIEVQASVMDRCFGGGFQFNSIRVDLTDTQQNEVVMSFKSKGYSEKCQPLSGTIFGDIAGAIVNAWNKPRTKAGS